MERFVQLLVAGGLALVAGLWMGALLEQGTPQWAAGLILAASGVVCLAAGIWQEIDY